MPLVRISPRHAPLWRSVRELQFGVSDGPILSAPLPWQERVVTELERGVEAAGISALAAAPTGLARLADAPPDGTASLVRALEAVLEVAAPPTPGVAVRTADGVPADLVGTMIDALADEGWPGVWLAPGMEPVDPATPTLLVAAHAMPPHLGTRCMSDDAVHLPIVFGAGGVEVGPVVRPGRTACLACVDAHRRDADPAWPVIMSQLLLRRAPRVALPLAIEAALVTAEMLDALLPAATRADEGEDRGREPDADRPVAASADPAAEPHASGRRGDGGDDQQRSAFIEAGGRATLRGAVTWRSHRRHPECLCAVPFAEPIAIRAA